MHIWKNAFIATTAIMSLVIVFSLLWLYNGNIINGNFNKLTITKMGQPAAVITDKEEIGILIDHINDSPRAFSRHSGFKYDYQSHGVLTFERDNGERVEFGLITAKGLILTNNWEVDAKLLLAE